MKKSGYCLENLHPSKMPPSERHLIISGQVQGVSYRYKTKELADAIGLTGYVRNQSDGTVMILAQGTAAQLDELERRCYDGSKYAHVEHIASHDKGISDTYSSFEIRST